MNFGPLDQQGLQCIGAIFDLSMGTNIVSGGGNPSWVIGDTFLVRSSPACSLVPPVVNVSVQKNVYSVYRSNPPSIGFAQLSAAAGGSGTPSPAPSSALTNSSATRVASSTGTPGAAPTGSTTSSGNTSKLSTNALRVCFSLVLLLRRWGAFGQSYEHCCAGTQLCLPVHGLRSVVVIVPSGHGIWTMLLYLSA